MRQDLSALELANDFARVAKRERAALDRATEQRYRAKMENARDAAERAEAIEGHLRNHHRIREAFVTMVDPGRPAGSGAAVDALLTVLREVFA